MRISLMARSIPIQRSLLLMLGLLLWQWLGVTDRISTLFFPTPSAILTTLWDLAASGVLWQHLGATLQRVLLGLLLGGIPAVLLGVFMGWSAFFRSLMDPVIAALHPLPKIALLPLIMILFGIGDMSKIVAVAIGAFFPLLINSMAGVAQIESIYFEAARLFRANRLLTFRRVILPGSLPLILTGARLALNTAVLITISVEMVAARQGLGALIWISWELFQTEWLYAGLLVIGLLGIAFNQLIKLMQTRLVPWQAHRTAGA